VEGGKLSSQFLWWALVAVSRMPKDHQDQKDQGAPQNGANDELEKLGILGVAKLILAIWFALGQDTRDESSLHPHSKDYKGAARTNFIITIIHDEFKSNWRLLFAFHPNTAPATGKTMEHNERKLLHQL